MPLGDSMCPSLFQFTLPCRERRAAADAGLMTRGFNSRSRVGSDAEVADRINTNLVSIHAPV